MNVTTSRTITWVFAKMLCDMTHSSSSSPSLAFYSKTLENVLSKIFFKILSTARSQVIKH